MNLFIYVRVALGHVGFARLMASIVGRMGMWPQVTCEWAGGGGIKRILEHVPP